MRPKTKTLFVLLLLLLSLLLSPSLSPAAIINVPSDYPTIQQAINASTDGDEIIVSPGTYLENIHFLGKNIILRSTDPTSSTIVATTVIDGNSTGSVVTFSGDEGSTCILSGFTITNGYSSIGGGIYGNHCLATLQYNSIVSNKAYSDYGDIYGGGIAQCHGTITSNTISFNIATALILPSSHGGGLYDCDGTIQNNVISDNRAPSDQGGGGGGLFGCDGLIQNNIISDNSAGTSGGGLCGCSGTIQYNTISGNAASPYFGTGGGLNGCDGLIQYNIISGNGARHYGGGLYGCTGTIQYNTISGNGAWIRAGGGLANCAAIIQHNTISGNHANWGGGGLHGCPGTIRHNLICNNNGGGDGGGLMECGGTIENNIISGNHCSWMGGGLANCGAIILNNTIHGNLADSDSGGGLKGCNGPITNCVIWQNTAPTGPQLDNCGTPSYSCIQDWSGGGIGNITDDPQLADPINDDFHLLTYSPCIDAGGTVTLTQDFEGDPRPYDAVTWEIRGDGSDYDIGADEFIGTALPTPTPTSTPTPTPTPSPTPTATATPTSTPTPTPCVILVPDDYSTIQEAIDAAYDGCEIIVSPGTYLENIHFNGKNVTLRSTDPTSSTIVANTVIDGNAAGTVVTFSGTELTTCVLSGFTVTNGYGSLGGGIYGNTTLATIQNNYVTTNTAFGSYPEGVGGGISECDGTIKDNLIAGNVAEYHGGGLGWCHGVILNNIISANSALYCGGGLAWCHGTIVGNNIANNLTMLSDGGGIRACDGTIENNFIHANTAYDDGGGLETCHGIIQNNTIMDNSAAEHGGGLSSCNAIIEGNFIAANSADGGGGLFNCASDIQNNAIFDNSARLGGGLFLCNGTLQNNTVYGNSAGWGGGFYYCNGTIRNCIIWQNSAPTGPQLRSSSTPSYSCIQDWTGGGTGNISDYPQLLDPASEDFHLLTDSPCIDAGGTVTLTQDFEGDPRPFDGTLEPRGDGSDFDIGADEFIGTVPSPSPSPTPTPCPTDAGSPFDGYADPEYLEVPVGEPFTIHYTWECPPGTYCGCKQFFIYLDYDPEIVESLPGIPPGKHYWLVPPGSLGFVGTAPTTGTQISVYSLNWWFFPGTPATTQVVIPTPTPTPTSTPIKQYHFEPCPEGWMFRTVSPTDVHVSYWDHASSLCTPSAIGINTPFDESTNYFGLWDSLDAETIPYSADSLYQANWLFSTNRLTTNAAPSLRFRMGLTNQKAFSYSRVYPGNWLTLSPSPDSTTYTLFFEPPISSAGLFLAFSLIDWTDDFRLSQPAGEVYLEEVSVYRHELSSFTGWQTEPLSFEPDTCTTSAAPPYSVPTYFRLPDVLFLTSGINESRCFGSWDTPNDLFTLEPSKLYRLKSKVSSAPHLGGPDLRLRIHTDDYRYAWYTYYVSSYTPGESALPPSIPTDYDLYLTLPFTSQPCHMSFDLIDFSSTFGGTLSLHDLSLHSHPFK